MSRPHDPPGAAGAPHSHPSPGVPAASTSSDLLGAIAAVHRAWLAGGGDDLDGADPHAAMVAIGDLLAGRVDPEPVVDTEGRRCPHGVDVYACGRCEAYARGVDLVRSEEGAMIYVIDNGRDYSDHCIDFVESDLDAATMEAIARIEHPYAAVIASAEIFVWRDGKPTTLGSWARSLLFDEDDIEDSADPATIAAYRAAREAP